MCLWCGTAAPARAQPPVAEYAVKAALLVKLPAFVYARDGTPAGVDTRLACLLGTDPFGASLSEAAARSQPPWRLAHHAASDDLSACGMVFVSASESTRLTVLLPALQHRGMLTVSDIPGFAAAGGMVELALEQGHVVLVINRRAAREQGLDFNAQLLRLARLVP